MQVLTQIEETHPLLRPRYGAKQRDLFRQAAHVLETTKVQQCFGTARRGKKMCAFAVIRKAGIDLPHYVNGSIIAKNDLDEKSFKDIAGWLRTL